jgi:hypothetical protein
VIARSSICAAAALPLPLLLLLLLRQCSWRRTAVIWRLPQLPLHTAALLQ